MLVDQSAPDAVRPAGLYGGATEPLAAGFRPCG